MSLGINTSSIAFSIAPSSASNLQPSLQSQLSNGAEELTFGRAPEGDKTRREFSKAMPQQNRLARVKQVLALLQAASATDRRYGRLQRLARDVVNAKGDLNSAMRRAGISPEERMLVLQVGLAEMGAHGNGSSALAQRILDAQQALDEAHGAEIRARLHALEVSLSMGDAPTEIATFQAGYLAVLARGSCAAVLDEILKHFRKRLRRALGMLTQTLGRELDSQWTSCDPQYLHLIRQTLYETGSIASLLDECENLFELWQKQGALCIDDPVQLARDLVKLCAEPWAVSSRFAKLAQTYAMPVWRLRFLGRVRSWIHRMPDKLFFDTAAQSRVFDAIQEALDNEAGREPL